MTRLIDGDELKKRIWDCGFPDVDRNGRIDRSKVEDIINNMPTVEPKKCKWIFTQYDNPDIGNWHCSECRHIIFGSLRQKPYFNFCPSCGADMRGDEG